MPDFLNTDRGQGSISPKTIRVLVIDDDEEDMFIVRQTLSRTKNYSFIVDWESSLHSGKEQIVKQAPDIVLLDLCEIRKRNNLSN